MSHLLDVSSLVACGWRSYAEHRAARRWLDAQAAFYTCPLTQLCFLRVSVSSAFRAAFEEARIVFGELTGMDAAQFIPDLLLATVLPSLCGANEVSDAYLVAVAKVAQVRLATLDDDLCRKPWAAGIAVNPLRP